MGIDNLNQMPIGNNLEKKSSISLDEAVKEVTKKDFPVGFFNDQFGVWFNNMPQESEDDIKKLLQILDKKLKRIINIDDEDIDISNEKINNLDELDLNDLTSLELQDGLKLIIDKIFPDSNADIQSMTYSMGPQYRKAIEELKENNTSGLETLITNIEKNIEMQNRFKNAA